MGAREAGGRASILVLDKPGQLAQITRVVANMGGNVVAFGQFTGEDLSNRLVTFKVSGLSEDQLRAEIEPIVVKIIDMRTTR